MNEKGKKMNEKKRCRNWKGAIAQLGHDTMEIVSCHSSSGVQWTAKHVTIQSDCIVTGGGSLG